MDKNKLIRQISLWLDDALPATEVRELEACLNDDSEARRIFLTSMRFHAEFSNRFQGEELLEAFETTEEPVAPRHDVSSYDRSLTPYPTVKWGPLFIAASLLICLGIGWVISRDAGSEATVVVLDSITPVSNKCRWYVEGSSSNGQAPYKSGDVIRVASGSLNVNYTHGTSVVVHSPAAYQLISQEKARMIVGRLTANVPEEGKGFTVITPQADVIDLGTEFGVEVNSDGATDVVVFKGEVDLDFHNQEATPKRATKRLKMGQAVRVDAVGTTSRIVSINGDAYSIEAEPQYSRLPIITEVRDNIERDNEFLSYYEIVHEGMREDALSHVDRIAHEYNGVTPAGMPEYLLTADYVKMFNNDKYRKTIQVEVTVSQPARLYVFLDNRHDAPEWLSKDFTDTGDDIGLDNGPFQSRGPAWHNKGPSGVGPGESIDDVLSVWVKDVESPGIVKLGSMATTVEVGANMYGIAAVPLEAAN